MKTLYKRFISLFVLVLFFFSSEGVWAQENITDPDGPYITISGVVRDRQNRRKIEYVNVYVPGTNIGTVTNSDGEFSIKVLQSLAAKEIRMSHIGYLNSTVTINNTDLSDLTVWMVPNSIALDEIIIRANDPRFIVEEAIDKIPVNYSSNNNLLTGFYRETVQKRNRYINISEAIIDVYKTSYKHMGVNSDKVQVLKGRQILSQRASDTLIVKLQGGPNLSIFVDIVKNPDILLDRTTLNFYFFKMEESIMLDNRPHYVIRFTPQVIMPYALYEGVLYIDKEKHSFSRAEFKLNMDDENKATATILRKKPFGLRFKPLEVSYLVTYKEQEDGLTYLSYIHNEVRFRCDWRRKLFGTNYTITSEMVVTDSKIADETIPSKMAFKASQSLYDNVSYFYDPDFWGAYNIIEPTESLESAVNKLMKQQDD
ncbi:carboxypeptidase-like regulatory domain-containing protein [Parabacteroides sp. OttesenSCG-928-G07]|nr:carboxypeptidase-like regulatory domain-containing protein [Parabacteroides sp. OttesenSCG-928-G07]